MVSEKLRILSKCRQVICITHLPQIAAMADQHFEIRKSASDGRTATSIRALDREAMVDELARLLGGAEITETVRQKCGGDEEAGKEAEAWRCDYKLNIRFGFRKMSRKAAFF